MTKEEEIRRIARETMREMASERGRGADVAIGADHGGFELKERLRRFITEELGRTVVDCGAFSADPVDYPDVAAEVARRVAAGDAPRGILIDGAGIGSSLAANKIPGVRAAVCHDERTVRNSREHNNANVLCLGSGTVRVGEARRLTRIWLNTPFAGGRPARRVDTIDDLDRRRGGEGEKA